MPVRPNSTPNTIIFIMKEKLALFYNLKNKLTFEGQEFLKCSLQYRRIRTTEEVRNTQLLHSEEPQEQKNGCKRCVKQTAETCRHAGNH